MSSFISDTDAIVEAAADILQRVGFRIERSGLQAPISPGFLAENEFFALGLLAGSSLHDLAIAESAAASVLLDRLGGLEGSAKRWDAYLVLLTPESSRHADDRERVRLVYNTRGVRRIVGQGLLPTEESVSRVLTPFLPLSDALDSSLGDIGRELVEALTVNGIDGTRAERYVSAYLDTGSLDNV